jgi:hypothetical protein
LGLAQGKIHPIHLIEAKTVALNLDRHATQS